MVIEQTETVYWIIYTTIRLATLLFYQETATLTGYLTSLVSKSSTVSKRLTVNLYTDANDTTTCVSVRYSSNY